MNTALHTLDRHWIVFVHFVRLSSQVILTVFLIVLLGFYLEKIFIQRATLRGEAGATCVYKLFGRLKRDHLMGWPPNVTVRNKIQMRRGGHY